MSSDLIALVVALTLGAVVVVLGLRRNLSEATRNGLPQFGGNPERTTATLGLYEGEAGPRRPLSPRQRRWVVSLYLLMALAFAAFAVLSADSRLHDASMAGLFALGAVIHLWQGSSHRSDGSAIQRTAREQAKSSQP
jgi:hypothetical protein